VESFIRCLGKVVEVRRMSDLEWSFKLRETIMLNGNLRVILGIVSEVVVIFKNPEGRGWVKFTGDRVLDSGYQGILGPQISPRFRECSQHLIRREQRHGR
jgi:hypothetical protein